MSKIQPYDWLTSDFDFHLPDECIAQFPVEPRDHAKLLHVKPNDFLNYHVYDLPDFLKPGDVLVMNNTKVIPARLWGKRGEVKVEVLLHKRESHDVWSAFARPGKRLKAGNDIQFSSDFSAIVREKLEGGLLHLSFNKSDQDLRTALEVHGEPPLPPYIKRGAGEAQKDTSLYQTVFASREGAVAAPTAGLHFTPQLLKRLEDKGISMVQVTLHVGAGTFMPVKAEHIRDHKMHSEWGEILPEVVTFINQARQSGRRIVAVGTTALRVLESAADERGELHPFSDETSIFITPGYRFRIVDALMTNFHLPKSTLFMLVSAFSGLERMQEAYKYAIDKNYRFYSYGDTTFLEKA